MRRVNVHIERLVLRGVRYEDRHAIAGGLQLQLAEILSAPETAARIAGSSTAALRVENVHLSSTAKPQEIGSAAARGIGRNLKP